MYCPYSIKILKALTLLFVSMVIPLVSTEVCQQRRTNLVRSFYLRLIHTRIQIFPFNHEAN